MKKIIKVITLLLVIGLVTACHNSDATKFKEDYESLNGETNKNGKEYRTITIDNDNPFVYNSLKKINKRIKNKETFIVYFGANWCPWCRSMLPTAIEKAKEKGIDKIYYIDVRPDNDTNKDIRDIYDVDKNGNIYLSHRGTNEYHEFLKYANNVLDEYTSHGISVKGTKYAGEKRVDAPSFILVKEGKTIRLETGVSNLQTDPYMELDDEIIKDMQNKFDTLYNEYLK